MNDFIKKTSQLICSKPHKDWFLDLLFGTHGKQALENTPVVLFGAGSVGQELFSCLRLHDVSPFCFCDNDIRKAGTVYCGIPVISFNELISSHQNSLIIIATKEYSESIANQLIRSGFDIDHILCRNWDGITESIYTFANLCYQFATSMKDDIVEHAFFTDAGKYLYQSYGVYASFAEARNTIASYRRRAGYERHQFEKLSTMEDYCQVINKKRIISSSDINSYEYCSLFWLYQNLKDGGKSVLDLGGGWGWEYYNYREYYSEPQCLEWTVCELDDHVMLGRQIASYIGNKNIAFIDNLHEMSCNIDVLFASGSFQYIENYYEYYQIIDEKKPRNIIYNRLPLTDEAMIVTIQKLPSSYVPLYINNRRQFIKKHSELGYNLVDDWAYLWNTNSIINSEKYSVDKHSGLCFRRATE
jgi:putative methyltransferase (TIGR04325 family)